jgi:pimeloyl-ACP methyl ester carboxylesterase
MWGPIAERLDGYQCIVPDLPGHGKSNDIPWSSLNETADALAKLVQQHAEGGRVHIVGLSLGAYVALRLAVRHPEIVRRTILSGLNVLPFPHPALMRLAGYVMVPFMKRTFFLRAQAKALRIPADQFDGYQSAAQAMAPRAFLRIGDELMSFCIAPDLVRATSPTLVLAGEMEHKLVRSSIPVIVQALPEARGYLVPGMGHGWSGEAPDLFAQTTEAWLSGDVLPSDLSPAPVNSN